MAEAEARRVTTTQVTLKLSWEEAVVIRTLAAKTGGCTDPDSPRDALVGIATALDEIGVGWNKVYSLVNRSTGNIILADRF